MTSNKPYLIRALYEWLVDNDATPYILVDTTHAQVEIPTGIDKDGQVVLNIAISAVQGLEMTNDHIAFSARFNSASRNIYIPMQSVMAIYSREDGEGMMFADDSSGEAANQKSNNETDDKQIKPVGPGLKIVK
jgi:stringent starvation protein B